ncbi:T9SS type B sorting domain-containing protein, partial [Tenacibaculum sp. MEBiC06402]
GLYNGKVLPSNDYWFNIELTDRNGNKISRKGHFSLLRK